MSEQMDGMAVEAILANVDDDFLALLRMRGDEVIEEHRAASGVPALDPHVAHAYACMGSAVDAFVAEIEQGVEQARRKSSGR
jgi:hypothetical protein